MPTIVTGLLAIAFGLWGLTAWWWSVVELMRGALPVILIGFGLIALASGVSRVRDEQSIKDEDIS
ncbi:MAG: magnetosome protein MamI [Mariprofundus sp.]|nr:magnetosome protein MamI [Mariprofundus sp.]